MSKSRNNDDSIIVAAIDFGTTFSGYAFSFRHEFDKDPLRVISSQWTTGSRVAISLKTSTCVLFDPSQQFHSFGFDAEDKYSDLTYDDEHQGWYYFRRFKMMLYDSTDVNRKKMIRDETGKEMSAMTVFSAAIRYLMGHLLKSVSEMTYDDQLHDQIKWVLTVPAIWDDAAKQFTREAAEMAGIPGHKLVLALEPEAASMFCKFLPVNKINGANGGAKGTITCFQPRSKYLVLDAGGGTVDITVHEVQNDGTLHELFKANGGPWGGTTVDVEFLKFIEVLTGPGPEVWDTFKQRHFDDYMDLLREFEVKKRAVAPDMDSRITFKVPITLHEIYRDLKEDRELRTAVKNIPEFAGKITFAGDKLRADPEIVKSLFSRTCDEIVKHLRVILGEERTKGTDTILMVGGFSESPMIRDAVERAFPQMRVISPHEAGLAVLKGAVIFGHNPKVITERICRYTYGISMRVGYDPGRHSGQAAKGRVYTDEYNRPMVRGTFSKLAEIGQPVTPDHPCLGDTSYAPLHRDGTGFQLKLFASTEKDPKYIDDSGCTKVGEIYVNCKDKYGNVGAAKVNLIFGKTELEVEAVNTISGHKTKAAFNFLD